MGQRNPPHDGPATCAMPPESLIRLLAGGEPVIIKVDCVDLAPRSLVFSLRYAPDADPGGRVAPLPATVADVGADLIEVPAGGWWDWDRHRFVPTGAREC